MAGDAPEFDDDTIGIFGALGLDYEAPKPAAATADDDDDDTAATDALGRLAAEAGEQDDQGTDDDDDDVVTIKGPRGEYRVPKMLLEIMRPEGSGAPAGDSFSAIQAADSERRLGERLEALNDALNKGALSHRTKVEQIASLRGQLNTERNPQRRRQIQDAIQNLDFQRGQLETDIRAAVAERDRLSPDLDKLRNDRFYAALPGDPRTKGFTAAIDKAIADKLLPHYKISDAAAKAIVASRDPGVYGILMAALRDMYRGEIAAKAAARVAAGKKPPALTVVGSPVGSRATAPAGRGGVPSTKLSTADWIAKRNAQVAKKAAGSRGR